VIPGVNDSQDELEATARFVAGLPSVQQVNLLPFHRTGLPKNTRLGRDRDMAEVQPPTTADMVRAAGIFSRHGLIVKTGG
jgi:pyruvate formate lyase activating enzyme